jgi:DNA modification methylase
MTRTAIEITTRKTNDLIPYVNNSRTHSDEQVSQVAASIKEFGFTNPILVDADNGIIAGHGRLMAAKKLGLQEVPTIELGHLSDAQKKAYVIADNKLALNAGWDEAMLAAEIEQLKDLDFDIGLLGFSADELLFGDEVTEGLTDEDEVPELPEIPKSKLGDIWVLGEHRVMCGDSTNTDNVNSLIDNNQIDLVYTDPPYGIDEKGDRTGRNTGLAKNHNFKDFKDDSIDYAVKATQIVDKLDIKRQVWWGANYYCHFLPQSNNWFIWDKRVADKMKDNQSDCEMAWVKSKWSSVRIFRHLWKGFNKDSERGEARVHPTQKPVALAEWSFDYFKEVDSVMDLFGGSGSTLIACENTKRKCYMMEFDEHYCDVIVKRWQDFTGKKATHAETGEIFDG